MDRNTSLSAAGTTNATESADVAKEAVADDLLVESRLSRELIETTEKAIMRKERHLDDDEASTEKENKIEVAANRYDLLCLEGPALSLRVFEEIQDIPTYTLVDVHRDSMLKMHVRPETSPLRPYIVCAVLRGITFDEARYNSFIELQDKLHQNICRRRTLVAIGTHDLDTIQGPFTYEALPPDQINFVPLKQERSFRADELMEFCKSDLKLKKFLDIILDSPVYPVIYDSNRTVLSLPPIINGAHSAISLKTKNVFIECTTTDLTKAKTVLNTMVTMFSVYCENKYQVEPVEVIYPDGKSYICPDLSLYDVDVPLSYINDTIGVSLEADESEVENHADGDPTIAKMETNVVLAKATQAEDGTIFAALNIVNSSLLTNSAVLPYLWEQMGQPGKVNLVELGPGRGTLMVDLLRGASKFKNCTDSVHIHLVDCSPKLKEIQYQNLKCEDEGDSSPNSEKKTISRLADTPVTWHTDLEQVPSGGALFFTY